MRNFDEKMQFYLEIFNFLLLMWGKLEIYFLYNGGSGAESREARKFSIILSKNNRKILQNFRYFQKIEGAFFNCSQTR